MNKKDISVVFMGTPDFAVPSLIEINERYDLKAVVTVPDKPKGRGRKMLPSPVKVAAQEMGVKVLQPEDLKSKEFEDELKAISPDIIAVIAFRILPEKIFSIPKICTFNIHGSLLPKYRGAAPINHAIINGDSKSGLTSFILNQKVDTGNILLSIEEPISPDDTAGDLHDRLMIKAVDLTTKTIELLFIGDYIAEKQNENLATPAPKLFRKDLNLDFNLPAVKLKNIIHGTSPVPASWTKFNGKTLKILRVLLSEKNLKPGEFLIDDNQFLIGAGENSISLIEFQLEGKSPVNIKTFLNGYRGEKSGFIE